MLHIHGCMHLRGQKKGMRASAIAHSSHEGVARSLQFWLATCYAAQDIRVQHVTCLQRLQADCQTHCLLQLASAERSSGREGASRSAVGSAFRRRGSSRWEAGVGPGDSTKRRGCGESLRAASTSTSRHPCCVRWNWCTGRASKNSCARMSTGLSVGTSSKLACQDTCICVWCPWRRGEHCRIANAAASAKGVGHLSGLLNIHDMQDMLTDCPSAAAAMALTERDTQWGKDAT